MPSSIEIKDIDGDGKDDIIVGKANGKLSVYRNKSSLLTSTISFDPVVEYTGLSAPVYLSAADLDADGKTDIVVADSATGKISVYRNLSTAGTILLGTPVEFNCGLNPFGTSIGDIDGDGKPDIVVANRGSNNISIFKNTGATGNISFAPKVDYAVTAGPEGIAICDLDGNSKTRGHKCKHSQQ